MTHFFIDALKKEFTDFQDKWTVEKCKNQQLSEQLTLFSDIIFFTERLREVMPSLPCIRPTGMVFPITSSDAQTVKRVLELAYGFDSDQAAILNFYDPVVVEFALHVVKLAEEEKRRSALLYSTPPKTRRRRADLIIYILPILPASLKKEPNFNQEEVNNKTNELMCILQQLETMRHWPSVIDYREPLLVPVGEPEFKWFASVAIPGPGEHNNHKGSRVISYYNPNLSEDGPVSRKFDLISELNTNGSLLRRVPGIHDEIADRTLRAMLGISIQDLRYVMSNDDASIVEVLKRHIECDKTSLLDKIKEHGVLDYDRDVFNEGLTEERAKEMEQIIERRSYSGSMPYKIHGLNWTVYPNDAGTYEIVQTLVGDSLNYRIKSSHCPYLYLNLSLTENGFTAELEINADSNDIEDREALLFTLSGNFAFAINWIFCIKFIHLALETVAMDIVSRLQPTEPKDLVDDKRGLIDKIFNDELDSLIKRDRLS